MLYREKGKDILIEWKWRRRVMHRVKWSRKTCIVNISYNDEYIFITPNFVSKNLVDEYGYYTKVYDRE